MRNDLLEFIAARIGKHVQSVGGVGGQCVDLVEQWAIHLGAATIPGNAVDLWANAAPTQWIRNPNSPINYPFAGNIVVWHPRDSVGIGPAGHTAIAVYADATWLLTFDQNWPTGSPCNLVLHTYTGVTGWLVRQ
jgi:CHAP domain